MALALLGRYDSAVDAALARSFLASEGVMSFLFDVGKPASAGFAAPVRLMVAEEDLDNAVLLLRGIGSNEADPSQGVQ